MALKLGEKDSINQLSLISRVFFVFFVLLYFFIFFYFIFWCIILFFPAVFIHIFLLHRTLPLHINFKLCTKHLASEGLRDHVQTHIQNAIAGRPGATSGIED